LRIYESRPHVGTKHTTYTRTRRNNRQDYFNETLYAVWWKIVIVSFESNGGLFVGDDVSEIKVTVNKPYNELPEVNRDDDLFIGWFDVVYGNFISSSDIVVHVLYAKYISSIICYWNGGCISFEIQYVGLMVLFFILIGIQIFLHVVLM